MSGLAGCVTDDGRTSGDWLTAAGSLLCHHPADAARRWGHGSLQLTTVSTGHTGGGLEAAMSGAISLFLMGETYNAQELERAWACGARADGTGGTRARTLLGLYLEHGLRPLCELNGAFVLGVWDTRVATLHVMTDRLGLGKVYYASLPGGVLFASEVKSLVAHAGVSRTVDLGGLAHLLALGHPLNDRTLYEAVRFLPGGAMLTYCAGKPLVISRYWEPSYATPADGHRLGDYADGLARRLEAAVGRCIEGEQRIGVPLSGGLDSRTVLGCVRRLRPHDAVCTVSIGHRHARDVVYGRRLARVCSTQHQFVPFTAESWMGQRADAVWLTDGMAVGHGWPLLLKATALGTCERVLTGFLGDILLGYALMKPPIDATDLEDVGLAAFRAYNTVFQDADLAMLLKPAVSRQLMGLAERDYVQCVREAHADALMARPLLAELTQRQQRYTASVHTVIGTIAPVAAPFADTEVVDFLLGIPMEYRWQRKLYVEMLTRSLPRVSQVAWARTELPLNAGTIRRAVQWRWHRLWHQQVPHWTGGRYWPHDRDALIHPDDWLHREPMRSYATQALHRGERVLAQWCDMPALWRWVDRAMVGSGGTFHQLNAWLTLVLWAEQADRIRPVVPAARTVPVEPVGRPVLGRARCSGWAS